MPEFPYRYSAAAVGAPDGDVMLQSEGLTDMASAAPREFGGSGDRWSPETLLVAAIADCFVLTFRAVARASRLSWSSLACTVTGTLDRLDHITQFSEFGVHAHLCVPDGVDEASAARALAKAKHACLITNSLKAPMQLDVSVETCKTNQNGPEEPTKVAIEEPVRPAAKTAA